MMGTEWMDRAEEIARKKGLPIYDIPKIADIGRMINFRDANKPNERSEVSVSFKKVWLDPDIIDLWCSSDITPEENNACNYLLMELVHYYNLIDGYKFEEPFILDPKNMHRYPHSTGELVKVVETPEEAIAEVGKILPDLDGMKDKMFNQVTRELVDLVVNGAYRSQ